MSSSSDSEVHGHVDLLTCISRCPTLSSFFCVVVVFHVVYTIKILVHVTCADRHSGRQYTRIQMSNMLF